jgi:hypothetical protein
MEEARRRHARTREDRARAMLRHTGQEPDATMIELVLELLQQLDDLVEYPAEHGGEGPPGESPPAAR